MIKNKTIIKCYNYIQSLQACVSIAIIITPTGGKNEDVLIAEESSKFSL